MRAALVAVALAGCIPVGSTVPFAPFKEKVVQADPTVTDTDLYASALWGLEHAIYIVSDRDPVSMMATTYFERVGFPPATVYPYSRARAEQVHYHRWRIRASEGLLFIDIDCGSQDLVNGRPTLGCRTTERAASWVQAADDLATFILDDAWRRAQRRRARLEDAGAAVPVQK